MARSDLLVALVQAGTRGDKSAVLSTTEAIIAEERAKQHNVLADKLLKATQPNSNGIKSVQCYGEKLNKSRDYISEILPERNLRSLVLTNAVRQPVTELIEEQQRASLLRAHGIEPRNKVLLEGPPGTGKTTLAEAIAEALMVPLFIVRYETMIGSFLGETAARLKRVFDYARTTPCVLFFDEFDAIGKERGDNHETGEIKRVVTSLLMQVDDLPSYTVFVAATNHPELLDRASWRRFQIRLTLPMPTRADIERYIESFGKSRGIDLGYAPSTISRKLGKTSYAEIEEFCLDVQRRLILSQGEFETKRIVSERMDFWSTRAQPNNKITGGVSHGRKTAAHSADSD